MASKSKPKPNPTPTPTPTPKPSPKNIIFVHPDLGIGGAERLVIDAAVGLQSRGHRVTIFTSHRDPQHCFDEARDGTLDVRVRGDTLVPRAFASRFTILCAVARQLHLLLSTAAVPSGELRRLSPDVFFVDQLSAGLPVLRYLYPSARILFYCHFPDLLLAKGRRKWWKRLYRVPFDRLEEWSMGFADVVCVNSGFTKGVVSKQWPGLADRKELEVVYPCVDGREKKVEEEGNEVLMWRDRDILLSINRFEKKKDIALAIRAYAGLGKHGRKGVRLVVAGGYDNRVQENVTYHKELAQLSDSLGLKSTTTKNVVTALGVPDDVDVLFLLSVPNSLKDALLKSARLLIYTPSNEHFGIVPLEAMLAGTPVLAANTGGPLETVIDGVTGWLCPPDDVEAWTVVMDRVLHKMSSAQLQKMSEAGRQRVMSEFSDVRMAERLEDIIEKMSSVPRQSSTGFTLVLATLSVISLVGILATVSLWKLYGS